MELIFLYHSDGVENLLKQGEKVKHLQLQYSTLLHKYLKSNHPESEANSLFSDGLMLIHDTERLNNLSQNKLKLDF